MNMYKKFQEAIKNGNFHEALLILFSNNLELKITTSVVASEESKLHSYSSNFNLLKGLKTEISSELLKEKYQNLNEFHESQVQQVDEIWQKNRETLINIFQILLETSQQQNLPEKNNLNLSLDNQQEKTFNLQVKEEKQVEKPSEKSTLNIDNFPTDNVIENEAESVNLETENIESNNNVDEDWNDVFNDVNDSEKIDKTPSQTSASLPIEDEDDWEKWIDDDDKIQTDSSEVNLEEFEWEDDKNWEDFKPNLPLENMTENQ